MHTNFKDKMQTQKTDMITQNQSYSKTNLHLNISANTTKISIKTKKKKKFKKKINQKENDNRMGSSTVLAIKSENNAVLITSSQKKKMSSSISMVTCYSCNSKVYFAKKCNMVPNLLLSYHLLNK